MAAVSAGLQRDILLKMLAERWLATLMQDQLKFDKCKVICLVIFVTHWETPYDNIGKMAKLLTILT